MGNQVRRIESLENKQFKSWLKLHESSGIKKEGLFLYSGEKLVREALREKSFPIEALIQTEDVGLPFEGPVYEVPKNLFKALDFLGTDFPVLVGRLPEIKTWTPSAPKGAEVFLALQDPGNLGSALRLACAFSVDRVVLLKEAAHPFHPKALRAAASATFKLELLNGPSIKDLSVMDFQFGLDGCGRNIKNFSWPQNVRLILGEEGRGLPDSLRNPDHCLSIPTSGKVESLNATHALAIALASR